MQRQRPRAIGHVLAAALMVGIVAIGVAPSSNAAQEVNPRTFNLVSSGVALIRSYGCGGKPLRQGTGFLVGASVVMTARHVVVGACRLRVRVGGETFVSRRWTYWYSNGTSVSGADLATIKLDHEATDAFVFRVRSSRVPVGSNLGMVGYPLGNRLSLNQGKLVARLRSKGAPLLIVRMLGAVGASGSPFIDDQGRVIGILQVGLGLNETSGVLFGLDLVRWWGPRARLDLCRAYPKGGIAGCPGAPPTDCETRDDQYLGKIGGPWTRFVNHWNAWIDAGNPPDSTVRLAIDGLEGLAIRSVEQQHLACSGGAKRVAFLLRGLFPLIDRIEAALDQVPPDPVELGSLLTSLDVRMDEVISELELLGFFRGGG